MRRLRPVTPLTLAALLAACAATTEPPPSQVGNEGHACIIEGFLYPVYSCHDGLLCNEYVCQKPSTVAAGGACSGPSNCLPELLCNFDVCEPPHARGVGDRCHTDEYCNVGLECHEYATHCYGSTYCKTGKCQEPRVYPDGGTDAATDAAASDASDDGGDAAD